MPNDSMRFLFLFLFGFVPYWVSCEFVLQIIHNNDVHAKFEQTNVNSGLCSEEEAKLEECYGGIARMKTAIKAAIEEAKSDGIRSLVFNAGDSFAGTQYYTMKKSELVVPMVNALEFDVINIGNHEFDDGIDNLVRFIDNVKPPVVCCNLDLKTEPRLQLPNLKPSHVLELDDVKVGVIGSVKPGTMETGQTENLKILKEVPCIEAEAKRLKKEGIKIIILLSHSGFLEDIKIAKAVPELSLIISSDSHTLLHTPPDKPPSIEKVEAEYPYEVKLESGKIIPIVQVYAFGKYLGKLRAVFDDEGNVKSAIGNSILLDSSIPEDEETKALVESWIAPLRESVKSPIAYSRVPLLPVDFGKREFESTFANLVTDSILDYAVREATSTGLYKWTSASIVLINTPAFRRELGSQGRISNEEVMDSLHRGNVLFEVKYAGSTIKDALEHSVTEEKGKFNFPNYLHFAGLKVVYDLSKPVNERVELIEALCTECIIPQYEKFNLNHIYTVILPKYLCVKGGQGFAMLKMQPLSSINLGIQVRDLVEIYIRRQEVIYPVWDGRVKVKNIDAIATKDIMDEPQ